MKKEIIKNMVYQYLGLMALAIVFEYIIIDFHTTFKCLTLSAFYCVTIPVISIQVILIIIVGIYWCYREKKES